MAQRPSSKRPRKTLPIVPAAADRDDAVRLVRILRKELGKLEASLREADITQADGLAKVKQRRARLQQAGLELMGLGIADQRASQRHNRARFEVLFVLTVRHAAAPFATEPSLAAIHLPDPNLRPRVPFDDYPPELVSRMIAQLDAMLGLVPDLAAQILPTRSGVEERLVQAASARARALRVNRNRSDYLQYVVSALIKARVSTKPNVERLKKALRRYG